jgi:pimeloyl-ACP methyl ester carboxylesterase
VSLPADAGCVEIDGPWQHRHVAANGARFHVVECLPDADVPDDLPTVVLLHGFPQFWWTWRAQLPRLAAAGYRAVALDLRGYGGSDKPPRGYDTFTLAADVDGVIRSLGGGQAVVVGHSWGAWIAWAMPTLAPQSTRAIAVLGTAHPLRTLSAAAWPSNALGLRRAAYFQTPVLPERALRDGDLVATILGEWSGSGEWPDEESLAMYRQAMRIPSVAHCSMEYYRWAMRSRFRRDGRRFVDAMRSTIKVPVLQLHGGTDPHIPAAHAQGSQRWVSGDYTWRLLPGGHFLAEECPELVGDELLGWLARLGIR